MKVTLRPFGPKVRFGRGAVRQVGRLRVSPPGADFDLEATLMLPEEAIPSAATSLASNWKYVDIWTFAETPDGANIAAYDFSAEIHPNLRAWANAD